MKKWNILVESDQKINVFVGQLRNSLSSIKPRKYPENTDGCGQRKAKSPLFPALLTKGAGQITMWKGE